MVWITVDRVGESLGDNPPLPSYLELKRLPRHKVLSRNSTDLTYYLRLRSALGIYLEAIGAKIVEAEGKRLEEPGDLSQAELLCIIDSFDPACIPEDAGESTTPYIRLAPAFDKLLVKQLVSITRERFPVKADFSGEHLYNRHMRKIGRGWHYPTTAVKEGIEKDVGRLLWLPSQSIRDFTENYKDLSRLSAHFGLTKCNDISGLAMRLFMGRMRHFAVATAINNLLRKLQSGERSITFADLLDFFADEVVKNAPSGRVPIDEDQHTVFIKSAKTSGYTLGDLGACGSCLRFHKGNCPKNLFCRNCQKRGHVARRCDKPISYGPVYYTPEEYDVRQRLDTTGIDILVRALHR